MKKRLAILLLAILTATLCMQPLAGQVHAETYGDLTYSVSDGEVTITKCASTASGELVIPDTIDGYPVTSIGYNAFSSRKDITKITIPSTVTYIGSWAFSSCAFTSIVIPEGVTYISENAFHSCGNLVDVTIPSTLTYIGNSAFNYCDAIENVYISDLQKWCQINFYSAWSNPLTPAEHLYLNGDLVSGEVTIPDGTTSIGKCVFNTGDITHINVPDSITKIDEYGFYGCSYLQWIELPNSVTTIDSYTFSGCSSLSAISIPDSVTTIEDRVFSNSGIVTVHLGKNVKSIWNSAFQGASNLSSFTVSEDNENFTVSDDILFSKDKTKLLFYPSNKEGTSYTVPDHVTEVGGYAFAYSRYLETVTLPDTVTILGNDAFVQCKELTKVNLSAGLTELPSYLFSGCSALTTVEIPESVKKLEYSAFSGWTGLKTILLPDTLTNLPRYLFDGCSALESITIPETVTSINSYAFARCTALTRISIPKNVRTIDSYAFYNSNNLKDIYFEGDAPSSMNSYALSTVTANAYYPYAASGWDTASAKQYGGTITWQGYSPTGEVDSGSCGTDVKWLLDEKGCLVIYGSGAMADYSTSSGITTAPWRAYAAEITSVVVCKDITSIGKSAFAGCANMTDLEIRGDAVIVGRNAVYGCTALEQIEFIGKPASLNASAFVGSAATVRYPANDANWMSVTASSYGGNVTWKPRGQTEDYIAAGTTDQQKWTLYYDGTIKFSGNFGLPAYSGGTAPWYNYRHHIKTLDIGTLRNVSSYAFYDCPNLTSIIWPEGSFYFTGIGERAFYNCDGLTCLFLPPDETLSVGSYAFYDCDNLKWVAFPARTTIGSSAFANCDSLKNLYIHDNYAHSQLSIASDSFTGVTANVCYPVGASTNSYGQLNYGGTLTWKATYYGPCNETVNWEFDETTGTLTISGTGSSSAKYRAGNITPWSCFKNEITSIVVEEGIDHLPEFCFEFCDQVTTISLPNTLKTISISAFNNCKALNNLILPDSLTTFDSSYSQFNRCSSLSDLYFFGTKEEWDAIPNSDKVRISADSGISMTIHYLVKQGSEPTCTEPGVAPHYRFDDTSVYAGYYDLEKNEISKPVALPANGHSWNEATCTVVKTCAVCNATEGNALGHDMSDWVVIDEATCIENGSKRKDCSRCDHFETEEIEATGHDHKSVVTAPTCTEKGYTTHTCTCGDTYVDSETNALGHDMGQWTTTEEATCTENGSKRKDCSRCDHFETEEIEATGHDHKSVVTAPTCTEKGYTTHTCHCGDSFVDTYADALGHDMGQWTTTEEATCTEAGSKRRECSRCDHFETEEIEATGHDYESVVTAPTCTEKGYTTHNCACGDTYVDSETNALGHDMGEWTTTKEATCTENGSKRKDCSRCDHFETEEIEATGHDHKSVVTAPTCTEKGYTTHTCHCGDSYVDSEKKALGHDMSDWLIEDATCTEAGSKTRSCKRDGCNHSETEAIKATGHSWKDATCTDAKTCKTCGATEGKALGHSWKDATCTAAKTCKTCGTAEGKALGHSWKDATCTAAKTCKTCGATEGKAAGHSYTNGTCGICGGKDPNYTEPKPESTVIRLAGSNRHDTALQIADQLKKVMGVSKFDAIIVAAGYDYADALAGSYLSAVKKAPILLSYGGGGKYAYLDTNNIDYIKTNLKSGGTVYLLGGENAVPKMYESQLSGTNVKRVGGANRFETNLLILKEAGVKAGQEILVCTSTNYADALAASATGLPILLVFNESGKLYGNQPDYLASLGGKNSFCIIGGTGAVGTKIEQALGQYGKVSRLAGADRLATSVLIAEKYFPNATSAVVAYGWNYPDGLCGGSLAYAMKAPLLLTYSAPKYYATTAAYTEKHGIKSGVILGGEGLVSKEAANAIF